MSYEEEDTWFVRGQSYDQKVRRRIHACRMRRRIHGLFGDRVMTRRFRV
jgi:hypothetical protein